MSTAASIARLALSRVEAILDEIERLDAATGGAFRDTYPREAFDVVARIERKMLAAKSEAAE